jgi:mono/diheme cytochrome c family protein
MAPRIRNVFLSLALAALAAGCGDASSTPKEPEHDGADGKMQSMPDSKPNDPVHTIVMPHDEPVFPPGTGREEFISACVVCHSPRYVTMQPQFPRSTWLSEVKKMKDVYGAHISDEQALQITDYLVSINGKPDSGQAPKGTYGE